VFYEGPQLEVEAHVEVVGELTLEEAHGIESTLIETVRGFDDVGDVHLHLDPEGVGEWETPDRPD
jgi:Predicted Co/Zn/Cd cation transporters